MRYQPKHGISALLLISVGSLLSVSVLTDKNTEPASEFSVERDFTPRADRGTLRREVLAEQATSTTTSTTQKPVVKVTVPKPKPAVVKVTPPSDVWGALGRCESGNNPTSHSSSGKYHGAFQFAIGTWQGLGYSGDPHTYPYATQLEAAKKLQARSGWGQWPKCASKLGLI